MGSTPTSSPYQARGVQWMWDTISRTGGLILADEMGLGKTLQIIALLIKITGARFTGSGDLPHQSHCELGSGD